MTNKYLAVISFVFGLELFLISLALGFKHFLVAIAIVLMQDLACLVLVSVTVILDKVFKKAIARVAMVAAAASVLFFGHGGHETLSVIKGFLDRMLVDECSQEFLIKFEGAGLCNLVSCVDCNYRWRWFNAIHEYLSETL